MASEIWSAILSGCPSVTDSDVNKIDHVVAKQLSSWRFQVAGRHSPAFSCPVSLVRAYQRDIPICAVWPRLLVSRARRSRVSQTLAPSLGSRRALQIRISVHVLLQINGQLLVYFRPFKQLSGLLESAR